MKMDRNTNPSGLGKYALIRLRGIDGHKDREAIIDAMTTLERAGVIDYGINGQPDEFFVIRLRDINARNALIAYAQAAKVDDPEWARDVEELADRAGDRSPFCKRPD